MSDRPNLTPYLVVNDATAAIEFYIAAFDAETLQRHLAPYSERIMHAHLKINGGDIMLCDDFSSEMKMKKRDSDCPWRLADHHRARSERRTDRMGQGYCCRR